MRKTSFAAGLMIASMLFVGCASAPETRPDQQALEARAEATVQTMVAADPSLAQMLQRVPGYVVFPEIAEGGFIVGGAQGVGVVYERGRSVGFAELAQGSLGLQAGGQSFSQLIVFERQELLDQLKGGHFDVSANAIATAVQSGAAARTRFQNGTAIFVGSESGLMAGVNVGGEQINFRAK